MNAGQRVRMEALVTQVKAVIQVAMIKLEEEIILVAQLETVAALVALLETVAALVAQLETVAALVAQLEVIAATMVIKPEDRVETTKIKGMVVRTTITYSRRCSSKFGTIQTT